MILVSIFIIIAVAVGIFYFLFKKRKEEVKSNIQTYEDMSLDQLRKLFLKRYKEFTILSTPFKQDILELALGDDIDQRGLYSFICFPSLYGFGFLTNVRAKFIPTENISNFKKNVKKYYADVLKKTEHPYTEEELILCKKYFGAAFLKVYYEEVKTHE